MDAVVKGAPRSGALPCHGTPPGARRPARRQRQLVTLRFAGRDRMAVSGRELPRTWVAGWCRREPFEDAPAVDAGRLAPGMARSGSDGLLVHDLLGHGRPDEADKLARHRHVGDRRALPALDEIAVAMVQADLRRPGPGGDLGPACRRAAGGSHRAPGRVAVVPGRLDQEPAPALVA